MRLIFTAAIIKRGLLFLALLPALRSTAQLPDHFFRENIKSVKFFRTGEPFSYPVINLGSRDELTLIFDDLDGDVKNYYFTYQLCNADWSNTILHPYDYIKGFQNVRINTYRNASISMTRYTNYQAKIPDRNCTPTRSGNYLLKVFLDGDTSKLVFTKRFLVVDNRASVVAQVQQPFNSSIYNTHQKLFLRITLNDQINVFNQQDIKVVTIQNFNWASAVSLQRPNIFRGNYFEYNDESVTSFPAGREWRWIDLRSLRLMSERMLKMDKQQRRTDVYVLPDGERQNKVNLQYRDLNGLFTIETTDNVNPYWQSDYAYVHFTFIPPGRRPYEGKNMYLFGELTNFATDKNSLMEFDTEKGVYEKTLLLKQGFYNYSYVTRNIKDDSPGISYENTEGNFWGTENTYSVMIYYRPFGGRADELIGFSQVNSMLSRQGF